MEELEQLKDNKGRPDKSLQQSEHSHPEACGGRDVIDQCADKAQAVDRSAGAASAGMILHITFIILNHFLCHDITPRILRP